MKHMDGLVYIRDYYAMHGRFPPKQRWLIRHRRANG